MKGGGTYKQGKRTNLRIFGMVEAEKPKEKEEKPIKAVEEEKPIEPATKEEKIVDTKKDILTSGEEKLIEAAAESTEIEGK